MYSIVRLCKNPDSTENIWNNLKLNIINHLSIKFKQTKINIIINNNQEKKITRLECDNLDITFMTASLSDDSTNDNLLMIRYNNDSKIVPIDNISDDFYNFIK
tara:strand:- start:52 stop:360 length:309 start_codon:yes stop_codon:yes gene_type:complete